MIRLFAADLDGTLLNSMHMTDRVRAAGAHFSVATGRVFRTTRDFGFCGGMCVVCANGSIVLGEGDEVLRAETVDPAFCVDLVSEFGDLPFEFVTAEHTYHRCSEAEHAAAFADAPRYWRVATRGMRMTGGPEYVYDCTSAQLASLPVCKVNLHLQGQPPEVAREVSAFLAEHPEVVNAPFDPRRASTRVRPSHGSRDGLAWGRTRSRYTATAATTSACSSASPRSVTPTQRAMARLTPSVPRETSSAVALAMPYRAICSRRFVARGRAPQGSAVRLRVTPMAIGVVSQAMFFGFGWLGGWSSWSTGLVSSDFRGQSRPLLRIGPPAPVTRAEDFGTSDRKRGSRLNESWANARDVVNGAEVFGPSDQRAGVCPVGDFRIPEIRSMEPKTSGRVTGRRGAIRRRGCL